MTDNENIKGVCNRKLCDPALEIVNRQKAEIERLKTSPIIGTLCPMWKNEARAEAIREFSKYLIDKAETNIINISDLPDLVAEFMKTEDK